LQLNLSDNINFIPGLSNSFSSNHSKKSSPKIERSNIIIIADDNHIINSCNKNVVDQVLKENKTNNYNVILVSDGYEIIKLFLNDDIRDKIKFIITDENMDFFNGSLAIKFIRNFEKLKRTGCLILASLSSNEDSMMKDYLIKCGAGYVFNKPLTKNNVRQVFREIEVREYS